MRLTEEEKQLLIHAKDEANWYKICDDIKARRNGIYPNYLAREILEVYNNKLTSLLYSFQKTILNSVLSAVFKIVFPFKKSILFL